MINHESMTILIYSCDAFSDIWKVQATLIKKYFLANCDIYLITDTNNNNYVFEGITIICAGEKTEITDRIKAVIPYIKTNFVFVTLDDYFLIKPVDINKFDYLVSLMINNKLEYIRLFLRTKPKRNERIKSLKRCWKITNSRMYSVNLYPSLWSVDFLKYSINGEQKNAWQYEVSLRDSSLAYNLNGMVSLNNEYVFIDGIRKGKFLRKAKKFLNKNKLYFGTRKTCSFAFEMKLGLQTFISRHFPNVIKEKIKSRMRKRGKVFYSDYREGDNSINAKT